MTTTTRFYPTLLLLFAATSASAAPIGPTYPAPGGNGWVNTGGVSGANALATWDYSAFDTNAFSELYFGLNQADYGALGAGLDSATHDFVFDNASGTTATWTTTSPYTSAGGPGDPSSGTKTLRLNMTVAGLGAAPWIDPTSVMLPANLGAVVDNSAGSDFTLQWEVVVETGGPIPLNSYPQPSPGGQTRINFATGFYFELPVNQNNLPEPSSCLLLMVGVGLLSRTRGARKAC